MSRRATEWAWTTEAEHGARLVLLALAEHHNGETGQCNPNVVRLMKYTRLGKTVVVQAIAELEALGLVIVDRKAGCGSWYRFSFRTGPDSEPVQELNPSGFRTQPVQIPNPTGSDSDPVTGKNRKEPESCPKGEGLEGQAELLHVEPAPKAKAKTPRKRDPIFDALAVACGHNLGELTKKGAGSIATAVSEIRGVSPDVTPEEIARRVATYRSRHPQRRFSEQAIAKDWSRLGGGGTRSREELEAILAKHPGNPDWGGYLAENVTREQRDAFAALKKELKQLRQPESRAA
jgi:hypothetical protein